MNYLRLIGLLLLTAAMCVFICAQNASVSPAESKEEKEKARLELEKKAIALLNRTADEASLLKLPENRAYVYANAADLLWTHDEKRARRLFRDAAEQIILAQAELDKAAGETPVFGLPNTQPRSQILQMIARRDADLALELLIQTRSPRLIAEMQKAAATIAASQAPAPTSAAVGTAGFEGKFLAQNELRLEQSFAALAAENNPEKAVKMIRESLAKNGVTSEVFQTLRRLTQKDEETAKSLLSDVIGKLLESDFSKKENERRAAYSFLMQFSPRKETAAQTDANKQKILKADERQLKDVANKIVDNFLQAKNYNALMEAGSVMPLLEKLVPERAAQIKNKKLELKKTAPESMVDIEAMNAVNSSDATPQELIKNASKIPAGMRSFTYERAVTQLVEKGEGELARQLLNEAPASAERDRALSLVDSRLANKAIRDGKLDDARKFIGKIANKQSQIEQLVVMARAFYAKNTKEDREAAGKLMDEAKQLLSYEPENEEEINGLLAIIAGYAVIEPERSFKLLEPLVLQTNELLHALALVAKYNKRDQRFRNGEMSFVSGMGQMRGSIMRYRGDLALLAAFDFERTRMLADRLTRSDAQAIARLALAQSVLEKRRLNGGFTSSGEFIATGDE
jgi:hypothetical protein